MCCAWCLSHIKNPGTRDRAWTGRSLQLLLLLLLLLQMPLLQLVMMEGEPPGGNTWGSRCGMVDAARTPSDHCWNSLSTVWPLPPPASHASARY